MAYLCDKCGKEFKNKEEAVKHEKNCKASESKQQDYTPQRSKKTAIILAIFLSYWAWLYSYKYDAWKFWLGLVFSIFIMPWIMFFSIPGGFWAIILAPACVWIFALVDICNKDKRVYTEYHK